MTSHQLERKDGRDVGKARFETDASARTGWHSQLAKDQSQRGGSERELDCASAVGAGSETEHAECKLKRMKPQQCDLPGLRIENPRKQPEGINVKKSTTNTTEVQNGRCRAGNVTSFQEFKARKAAAKALAAAGEPSRATPRCTQDWWDSLSDESRRFLGGR